MAMSRLSRTMMLITEKEPNMRRPEKRVNSLMPVSSKLSRSIRPKMAQKRVWEVSQMLEIEVENVRWSEPESRNGRVCAFLFVQQRDGRGKGRSLSIKPFAAERLPPPPYGGTGRRRRRSHFK